MSEAGGPCRGPSADDYTQSIAVAIRGWRLAFVVDSDPSTGQGRDIARTVALVTGCDVRVALAAVLEAIASPTVIAFKAAA